MSTTEQKPHAREFQERPVHELPLAPLTRKSVWASFLYFLALAGWTNDPGYRFGDAGPLVRGVWPRVRGPLRKALVDPWMDGWTGEVVFVNSPKVIREMYDLPAGDLDTEAWKKSYLLSLGAQSPFVLRGEEHARVRRALVAELTPARVETYRERSVQLLDEMIDALPLGAPVNLHDFYTRFTQEVILRVAFGWHDCADLEELKESVYKATKHYFKSKLVSEIAAMLNGRMKMMDHRDPEIANRDTAPFSGRDDRPLRILRKAYRLRAETDRLIHRKIAELRANPNDSVVSRLITQGAAEDPAWTDKRLRDIIATLVMAGHETSVLAYSWATQYVLHNADARENVVAEARQGHTDRYAQACNTEALRMRSPVIATGPAPLLRDIAVAGYRIRKGALVFPVMAAVHYNKEVYTDPYEYRPERWLDGKPERYGFVPFGIGPHRCPGSTFYLTEASIVTQRLFGRLDMVPRRDHVDNARFIFGSLCRPRTDTEVVITHRRNASDVPWYRPGANNEFTSLKAELIRHSQSTEPASCPHRAANT